MPRRLAVLLALLLMAVASTGCTKDEGTPTITPSPPPTASPLPEPPPTPPASPTAEPTPTLAPTPTPTPPAPTPTPFYLNVTHDYAQPARTQTFVIPEGTATLEIRPDFTPVATALGGVCAGPSARMVIKRPDATVYDDATMGPGTGDPGTVHCPVNRASATGDLGGEVVPGTWSVEFSGQGQGYGHVRVAPAE